SPSMLVAPLETRPDIAASCSGVTRIPDICSPPDDVVALTVGIRRRAVPKLSTGGRIVRYRAEKTCRKNPACRHEVCPTMPLTVQGLVAGWAAASPFYVGRDGSRGSPL